MSNYIISFVLVNGSGRALWALPTLGVGCFPYQDQYYSRTLFFIRLKIKHNQAKCVYVYDLSGLSIHLALYLAVFVLLYSSTVGSVTKEAYQAA